MSGQISSTDGEKSSNQTTKDAQSTATESSTELGSSYFTTESSTKSLGYRISRIKSKDLKVLTKCSIAVWIFTLFIVIQPTLVVFGQATFFGCIALFFLPPSGTIFVGLAGGVTLILGMALAWAWGTISMKAALATRPAADLQARFVELQQSATQQISNPEQASGQTAFVQVQIFNGFMLDARVSITYFCMIGLFIYMMARLRMAVPKLMLIQIFATIVSDIYLTIAPLIPTFQGTIPSTLIKPAAAATGVGLVCNLLIFPQSVTSAVLEDMENILAPMHDLISAFSTNLGLPKLEMQLEALMKTKKGIIASYRAMSDNFSFLALDVSLTKWDGQEVAALREPMRQTLVAFLGVLDLQLRRAKLRVKHTKYAEADASEADQGDASVPKAGKHHESKALALWKVFRNRLSQEMRESTYKVLHKSSAKLLSSCQNGLDAAIASIASSHKFAWKSRPSIEELKAINERNRSILVELRADLAQFIEVTTEEIWESELHPSDDHKPAGVAVILIFEERIAHFAGAVETLLSKTCELADKHPKRRLCFPRGLSKAGEVLKTEDQNKDNDSAPVRESERQLSRKSKKSKGGKKDNTTALDNIRRSNGRQRNAFSLAVLGTFNWFFNTDGLFALRVLVVTIAFGVPAVLPHTAGFYYRQKGLWGLIMGQLAITPYSADFIFGFISRVVGTVLGGIIGMVCWYIGSGHGPGNSYGIAAVMAAVIVPLMALRLFGPPVILQGGIMMAATVYLVVAYSWVDTHIPSYGNPGVGYTVFWRRTVLVLAGFGAGAITMLFPRPPSASRHYREVLANTLSDIRDRYALLILTWKTDDTSETSELAETEAIKTAEILMAAEGPIQLTRLEFSTSSVDTKTLATICELCLDLNQSITTLLIYATRLKPTSRERFIKRTAALDEQFVAEIMAVLSMMQSSIQTGEPLPAVLPTPLLARSLEITKQKFGDNTADSEVTITKEILSSEQSRRYCAAFSAYVQFLDTLDDIVIAVKTAIGETSHIDLGHLA